MLKRLVINFKNSRISDEKMEKYRKIYFNDYNKNYNEN